MTLLKFVKQLAAKKQKWGFYEDNMGIKGKIRCLYKGQRECPISLLAGSPWYITPIQGGMLMLDLPENYATWIVNAGDNDVSHSIQSLRIRKILLKVCKMPYTIG